MAIPRIIDETTGTKTTEISVGDFVLVQNIYSNSPMYGVVFDINRNKLIHEYSVRMLTHGQHKQICNGIDLQRLDKEYFFNSRLVWIKG